MKRVQVNEVDLSKLINGEDIILQLSDKRAIIIGTMSDIDIKKKKLQREYESKIAALEQQQ